MRRPSLAAAALLALSLTVAGCGSDSLDNTEKQGGEVKTSVDEAAAAKVPQAIKDKGTLTVGTDASYAPSEFLAADGKTVQGFDVDLF
ncbi:MAG: ABC transporter substrate-binding protein, partial [Myxococcales bacterium]